MTNAVINKAFKMKIQEEANSLVGGAYNCHQDGDLESLECYKGQTLNDLIDDIYKIVVSDLDGFSKKEIRFLGSKTIKLEILKYLKKDIESGDILELSEGYGIWKGTYSDAQKAIEQDGKVIKTNSYSGKSMEELWGELKALGGECKKYTNEKIQRMRLIMAIKKYSKEV